MNGKKIIKNTSLLILGISLIQLSTFYAFANQEIIKSIGANYEAYAVGVFESEVGNISFISKSISTEKQVQKYFKGFENKKIRICQSTEACPASRATDDFYIYCFDFKKKNPFGVSVIEEIEFAKFFAASWESKYVWIFYKWVLIEKASTGIS